ncbi:MAG: winged helix-turn-helix domain-containing protein [Sulfolobaceae archaeon]|nr:winged helix-turn-helix domain-containing protein [Sulfolobaceae archaeon]
METKAAIDENTIYNIIKETGGSGITLQQLSSNLGLPSKQISLILRKLIEKKKIAKRAIKENGKSVIKYFALEDYDSQVIYIKLDEVINTPCFTCKNLFKCGNGSYISPQSCYKLSEWIFKSINSA